MSCKRRRVALQNTADECADNSANSHETDAFERVKNQLHVLRDGSLELRQSENGAGLGLFALRSFAKGEPITEYYGEQLTYDKVKKEERNTSHIRRHMAQRYVIDGRYMADGTLISKPTEQLLDHGAAAYANHSAKKQNADYNYVDSNFNKAALDQFWKGAKYALLPQERITYIYAIKDIVAGSEILLDYGKQYWQNTDEQLED